MKMHTSILALKMTLITVLITAMSACADKTNPKDLKLLVEKPKEAALEKFVLEFDRQFIVNAAEISIEQIQLGQLAQHNSNMIDVMRLGKMIQVEHHSSLQTLNTIAQKKSIHLQVSMTDSAMDTYTTFRKKTGTKFDKLYCTKMIKEHEDAIALFESALSELSDAEIHAWALSTLPVLRTNLDQALICQKYCAQWTRKVKSTQIAFAKSMY